MIFSVGCSANSSDNTKEIEAVKSKLAEILPDEINLISIQETDLNGFFEVNFEGINVLEDQNIREGIKTFSDWPTIPQLYVKKEFVGGCDIVKEMYESGELAKLLETKSISFKAKN